MLSCSARARARHRASEIPSTPPCCARCGSSSGTGPFQYNPEHRASIRVLTRVRNAGRLWRQALAGNVVCAALTVWLEHTFIPGRIAAFHAVVATGPRPVTPQGLTLEEVARIAFATSSWTAVVILGILLGILVYAGRNRTREAIG